MDSVLIVDDDASVLATTIAAFEQAGYAATGASTFQAAKRLLHDHPPDVLIAAVRLGAFNGFHLALLGQQADPTMMTIVTYLPADRGLESIARRLDVGFWQKPSEPGSLVSRLVTAANGDSLSAWPTDDSANADRRPSDHPRLPAGRDREAEHRQPDGDRPLGQTPPGWRVPRRYPRTRVRTPATVEIATKGTTGADIVCLQVLGAGGACVDLQGPYPVGQVLGLRFTLPGTDDDIACEAIVRNAVRGECVGVEFLNLPIEQRERLHAWVAHAGPTPP